MKKKPRYTAKMSKDMAKMSNDTAKMPAGAPKKIGLLQEAKAAVESCRYMALHPADATKMETERDDIGFKTGALWLLPSFAILLAFVGLVLLISPTISAPDENGILTEVPKIAIFLFLGVTMCASWALMILITMAGLHILAKVMGGNGTLGKLFHMLARFLLVLVPIWIVASLADAYLPSLSAGTTRFTVFGVLIWAYFVAVVAQVMPVLYGVSKKRGLAIGMLFWVIITLIGLATSIVQTGAGTVA